MLGDTALLGDCPPERSTYVGLPRLAAMQLRSDASHGMATAAVARGNGHVYRKIRTDYTDLDTIKVATRPDLEGEEKGKII